MTLKPHFVSGTNEGVLSRSHTGCPKAKHQTESGYTGERDLVFEGWVVTDSQSINSEGQPSRAPRGHAGKQELPTVPKQEVYSIAIVAMFDSCPPMLTRMDWSPPGVKKLGRILSCKTPTSPGVMPRN